MDWMMGAIYGTDEWPDFRVAHARHRARELLTLAQEYAEGNPLGFEWIESGPRKRLVVQVPSKPVTPPPLKAAALVGEVANALRGALDSTVWQIARNYGCEPFEQVSEKIRFPILWKSEHWFAKRQTWLLGIPLPVVDRIRDCQPFEDRTGYPQHPLAALRHMSNRDKHSAAVSMNLHIQPELETEVRFLWSIQESEFVAWLQKSMQAPAGNFYAGQVIFSGSVPPYISSIRARGAVDVQVSVSLGLGAPLVLRDLARIIDYVEQVIWFIRSGEDDQVRYLRMPRRYEPHWLESPDDDETQTDSQK